MPREIERKFLVDPGKWHPGSTPGVRIRQGYLSAVPDRIVRVRRAGPSAFLTIKGPTTGIERAEFEYPLPPADADDLLDHLCLRPLIEKVRYHQPFAGHTWEIDVFEGDNRGLIVAEVELDDPGAPLTIPRWAVREVSAEPRYTNASLVSRPFSTWAYHA